MSQQFKRVTKPKDAEEIKPNEIRITSQGRPRNYISYAVSLFEPSQEPQQPAATAYDTVVFKAMRRAINKAVSIVEIVKRRVKGLHQITEIHSTPITDEFEPKEEGLQKVTNKRTVSSVTITLSKKQLDTKNVGYQVPLSDKEVEEDMKKREQSQKERIARQASAPTTTTTTTTNDEVGAQQSRPRRRGGRGRGRGGRPTDSNDNKPFTPSNNQDEPQQQGGRGRGRGRGSRGGRGRGARGSVRGRGGRGRGSRGGNAPVSDTI